MVVLAKKIPGAIGEAYESRRKLNAMVDQIEWETSRRCDNDGAGRIPALFVTLTAAVYKWERLSRLIRRWAGLPEIVDGETAMGQKSRFSREADEYPAIVEWYFPLKLEMMLRLCYRNLEYRAGLFPTPSTAGGHFATFEWGAGGMTHLHAL